MTPEQNTGGSSLDEAIARVVGQGNGFSCGIKILPDRALPTELDGLSFARPARTSRVPGPDADADTRFRSACPGVRIGAQRPPGSGRYPATRPFVQAWAAWSTDAEVLERGSGKGTIITWLVETEQSAPVSNASVTLRFDTAA